MYYLSVSLFNCRIKVFYLIYCFHLNLLYFCTMMSTKMFPLTLFLSMLVFTNASSSLRAAAEPEGTVSVVVAKGSCLFVSVLSLSNDSKSPSYSSYSYYFVLHEHSNIVGSSMMPSSQATFARMDLGRMTSDPAM